MCVCVLCAGLTEPHRTGAVLRQPSGRPLPAGASADRRRQLYSSRPVRSVSLAPRLSSRISFILLQFSLAYSFSDDPDVKLIQSACKNKLLNIRSSGSLLFKHTQSLQQNIFTRGGFACPCVK